MATAANAALYLSIKWIPIDIDKTISDEMTSSMGNSERILPSMVCPMRRCALEIATGSAARYSR